MTKRPRRKIDAGPKARITLKTLRKREIENLCAKLELTTVERGFWVWPEVRKTSMPDRRTPLDRDQPHFLISWFLSLLTLREHHDIGDGSDDVLDRRPAGQIAYGFGKAL